MQSFIITLLILFVSINAPAEAHLSNCNPTQVIVEVTNDNTSATTVRNCQNILNNRRIYCPDLISALSLPSLTNKCIVLCENQTLSIAINITAFTKNLTITTNTSKQTILVTQHAYLHFMHGENLHISNLIFVNNFASLLPGDNISNHALIGLESISGLMLRSIKVYSRLGYALQIFCVDGDVSISDINITGVGNHTSKGLYMEISGNSPRLIKLQKVRLSSLVDNFNDTSCLEHSHQACGRGAGIGIFFRSSSSNVAVDLSVGTFYGNKARFGAGLYVKFPKVSSNLTFRISNCRFTYNSADYTGGGMLVMGVKETTSIITIPNNTVLVTEVYFQNNTAGKGGGLSLWNLNLVGCSCQLSYSNFSYNTGTRGGDLYASKSTVDIHYRVNTNFSQCSSNQPLKGCGSVYVFETQLKVRSGNFSWHRGSGIVLYYSKLELSLIHI